MLGYKDKATSPMERLMRDKRALGAGFCMLFVLLMMISSAMSPRLPKDIIPLMHTVQTPRTPPPFRQESEIVYTQKHYRPKGLPHEPQPEKQAPRDANGKRTRHPAIGEFPDSRIQEVVFEDNDDGHQGFDKQNLWNPHAMSSRLRAPRFGKKEKLLFLVTGQMSRLELESKILNVMEPQMARYDIEVLLFVKVFVKMESMQLPRWPSPYEITSWDANYLHNWVLRCVPGAEASSIDLEEKSEMRKGRRHVYRKILTFNAKARGSNTLVPWRIVLIHQENDGLVVYQPTFKADGYNQWAGAQQDTFRNFRKAMIYIEELELARDSFFDVIFRLRDDTFAFSPFLMPPEFDRDSFGTPQCVLASYPLGYSDHNFILGRNIAAKVLRGMVESYYFRITENYPFVEAHLKELVTYIAPKHIFRIPDCYWPFFPVIYADLGNGQFRMEFREFEIEHYWRHKCPKKWFHAPNDPNNCAWIKPDMWLHPRAQIVQAYLPLHLLDKATVPDDVLEILEWYNRKWPASTFGFLQPKP
ncbi:Hypothetical Protein FCC1311_021172 [Hondaea fermentalgiana]|uniref:Uncharacterized protein n=1 Tax=Hondaea fermentalgiana TaxID=2315210 RepID=A0A2R5G7X7_9STRA|nr:Hypothetical Protein FCC1311_021172 [Hondaea fermentalgiana]|eukprot:GBG25898.1 Hypothetical Protein FCC1311_021172 [Hondaea fermentalgiana]